MNSMMTIITLQNNGREINDFRCKNGFVFSISDNQCKDVPEESAKELMNEYPQLVCMSVTTSTEDFIQKQNVESEVKEEKPDPYIEQMKKESVFACSMCGNKFDTNHGMRIHMSKSHKA